MLRAGLDVTWRGRKTDIDAISDRSITYRYDVRRMQDEAEAEAPLLSPATFQPNVLESKQISLQQFPSHEALRENRHIVYRRLSGTAD